MKITVPATTSNIGSGFDVLGIALNIFLEVEIKTDSKNLKIEGCPSIYCNEENLILKGMKKVFELYEKNYWDDIKNSLFINIKSDIPVARGLGSSASCIASGLVFANEYLFQKYNIEKLEKIDLIKLGTELEGHPDNISAAILGGMTSSCIDKKNNIIYSQKINIDYAFLKKFSFYILIPDFEVKTEMARKILPKKVELQDAVFNLSRLALLFTSLINKEETLFALSFDDRLHQKYRSKFIYNYDEIINFAKESGAIATFISGSGSSLIAIKKNENRKNVKEDMEDKFEISIKKKLQTIKERYNKNWLIKKVDIEKHGAKVVL
ncbi:MAG: homoserine kinase [Exilispira sp.]